MAEEKVDLYTVNRIKAEEFQNSKVMENAFYLSDVYGPRLTGSPGLKAAAEWAVRRMTEWGLANPAWKSGDRSAGAGLASASADIRRNRNMRP